MEVGENSLSIMNVLRHIDTHKIGLSDKIEVFLCPINSNCFDYDRLIDELLESVADFSMSRKLKDSYGNKYRHRERDIKDKFIEYKKNKGEMGEFLLYCFLEGHLKAPKILSKLELKTSNKHYVNGSDGVHFLKLENGNFQLVFGESKTYQNMTDGLRDAFSSINEFKNEKNKKSENKSGINYEKRLISNNLDKETWTDEEKELLTKIIFPTPGKDEFQVDDAFGIFIGFEIEAEDEKKALNNDEFRMFIESSVKAKVVSQIDNIKNYIDQHKLYGHSFYIYAMPFTELDKARMEIMKGLLIE